MRFEQRLFAGSLLEICVTVCTIVLKIRVLSTREVRDIQASISSNSAIAFLLVFALIQRTLAVDYNGLIAILGHETWENYMSMKTL